MSAESAQLAAVAANEQVVQSEYSGQHRAAEAAEEIGWRQRLSHIAGKVLPPGALLGGTTAAGIAMDVQPAAAASCYGDYCSGQYAGDRARGQDARPIGQ